MWYNLFQMPSKWRKLVATYGQTLREIYENIGLAIFYIEMLLKAKKLLRERVKEKKKSPGEKSEEHLYLEEKKKNRSKGLVY